MTNCAKKFLEETETKNILTKDDNSWEEYSTARLNDEDEYIISKGRRKRRINAESKYYQG